MKLALIIILSVAMAVLFFGGYFVGSFKTNSEKKRLLAVPLTISILMLTVIIGVYVITRTS